MKNRARIMVGLFVLSALIVIGAGWFGLRPSVFSSPAANILFISIDTCRADRLSCYGYPRSTTPHIDAIAREGYLFKYAIAPVPLTLPSHCSMMTGTRPPFHGVHDNLYYRLGQSNVTLAEVLKEAGYKTGAVVGAYMMAPQFGLAQGFDDYDARFEAAGASARVLGERRAAQVNEVAKAWLSTNAGQRFFLFLHYFDPHFPYQPPAPFSGTFAAEPYAGEIAYVDHCIGQIVGHLRQLGLYDSTLIIVTSDHGESLGEHGEESHGWFIYHSTTRVPLIVKLPERNTSHVIDDKVALIDLAPTILEYVGLPIPSDVQGKSLTPYFPGRNRSRQERYFYTESLLPTRFGCSSLLGLETGRWKYIQSSRPELYDLINDPNETTNVVDAHAETARSFRDRLMALLKERTRTHEDEAKVALDPETVKRLEGLGYVGGGKRSALEFETGKEDAKDFLPFYRKVLRVMDLTRRNPRAPIQMPTQDGKSVTISRSALAGQICSEILAERPDVAKAHPILAKIAYQEGDLDTAGHHYGEIVRIDPTSAEAHNDLGHVRKAQGKLDEAVSLYRKAVQLVAAVDESDRNVDHALVRLGRVDPVHRIALLSLGDVLFKQRKIEAAANAYREALRLDPGDAKAEYVIGLNLARQGRPQEAIEAYQRALAIKPTYKPARRALQKALAAQGEATPP